MSSRFYTHNKVNDLIWDRALAIFLNEINLTEMIDNPRASWEDKVNQILQEKYSATWHKSRGYLDFKHDSGLTKFLLEWG